MNAEAGTKFLAIGNAVGQRVFKIAPEVVVRLHRDDIGAIGEQQHIFCNLQMVRTRVVTAGKKPNRLQAPRVRSVQNRQAIAEHVPDIQMTPVQHDLDAIGMAA